MLNNTNSFNIGGNTTKVSFNTPSTGIIQKSHPKSRFIRFHNGSALAKTVLDYEDNSRLEIDNPSREFTINNATGKLAYHQTIFITVLQLMIFGENWIMAEIVNDKDLIDITN